MSEEAKVRKRLKGRVAVKPGIAGRALGLGRAALKTKIEDGTVPTNGIGNIPCDWLLKQMQPRKTESAA